MSLWPKKSLRAIGMVKNEPSVHGNAIPPELSFFAKEEDPPKVCLVYCPNWPPQAVQVFEDQVTEEEIARHVAWVWDKDPQTLVCAAVKGANTSEAFVADVVATDNVYKRLVFCKQLTPSAAWVSAAPKEEELMKLFTVRPQGFSVNGSRYVPREGKVEDGDVFEAVYFQGNGIVDSSLCDTCYNTFSVKGGNAERSTSVYPCRQCLMGEAVHPGSQRQGFGFDPHGLSHSSFLPRPVWHGLLPGREELVKTTGDALPSTALKMAGMGADVSGVGHSSLGYEGRSGRFGFDRMNPVGIYEASVVEHSRGFGLDPKVELVCATCPEASMKSQKDGFFHALHDGATVEAPEETIGEGLTPHQKRRRVINPRHAWPFQSEDSLTFCVGVNQPCQLQIPCLYPLRRLSRCQPQVSGRLESCPLCFTKQVKSTARLDSAKRSWVARGVRQLAMQEAWTWPVSL